MTLAMRDLENRELGIEEGIVKGIEQGREQRDREKIKIMLKKGKTAEESYLKCGAEEFPDRFQD